MEKTARNKAEDRAFEYVEKAQARIVEGVRQLAERVDAWWPEVTTSRFTERLPEYVDRGAHLAEGELDHEYRLVKRVIRNQRTFLKGMARAMSPHTPARPARKAPVKTAA